MIRMELTKLGNNLALRQGQESWSSEAIKFSALKIKYYRGDEIRSFIRNNK